MTYDPLEDQISKTLHTVAQQVPVRDRLNEFESLNVARPSRRWRFSEMPAMAGAVAFVAGLALVGGVLLTLRSNTQDPSDPAVLVAVDPTVPTSPQAGGPCLGDHERVIGDTGITVTGDSQSIDASLGYETINYCPGHPEQGRGGLSADGFFYSLDFHAVDVQPGGQITLSAPGYPGARLTANWSNDDSTTGTLSAELAKADDTTWQLAAPESVGVHRLDMRLDWAEGEATYAVLITTDGSASTRTTTSGPPRPGVSTDEAPVDDAIPPEVIFDDGQYSEIDFAGGGALSGKVGGVDALVFVCSGIQTTASDPTSPGLTKLMEDVTDEVLEWQECVPTPP